MSGTTSFSVRMDKDVKQQSEDIFRNLGVNMTTAINIFCVRLSKREDFRLKSVKNRPTIKPRWL